MNKNIVSLRDPWPQVGSTSPLLLRIMKDISIFKIRYKLWYTTVVRLLLRKFGAPRLQDFHVLLRLNSMKASPL